MNKKVIKLSLVSIFLFVAKTFAAPTESQHSLVVRSTEHSHDKDSGKEGNNVPETESTVPRIYQMHIQSNVRNRFANTTIVSKVKNFAQKSQEATFSVVLPETAFISGFIMEVDGKNYTAYVKEKEEAKRDYDQAVARGQGAAHVAVSARDSNRFTVSVNIEPETKAAFYLSYEELLKRQDGHYEQVINIHPGQPVKDLGVEVSITESRKIIDLKAPPLRSGNEIGNENSELDPRADLEIINDKTAIVRFRPNIERQKQLAHLLGTKEDEGLAGQFVVRYDVERDPQGGEVLIQDGYFVHFFAPTDLAPLPKHVVFVLDTSSSMHGQKIQQLKEAMHKILDELHEHDVFSLVEFNSNVKVWNLNNDADSVWYPSENGYSAYGDDRETDFKKYNFPNAYLASLDNIRKAKHTISEFRATAATDIYSALRVGFRLVELARSHRIDDVDRQPMLVFLTDGEPTVGLRSAEEITNRISEFNTEARKSPVFALSFGRGADKNFLQKLAIRNFGFAKHIYEAADAALQLQDFYRQISSPLLANVNFKYEPSVTSLTKTEFPIHFGGSEIVVCGWYGEHELREPVIEAFGERGRISLKPHTIERSVTNIERLWAYLTIKQLLEKKEVADKDKNEFKKKALDLALKYSFVTSVSSLVVVKPNATNAVDTEEADGGRPGVSGVLGYRRVSHKSSISSASPVTYGDLSYNRVFSSSAYDAGAVVPLSGKSSLDAFQPDAFDRGTLREPLHSPNYAVPMPLPESPIHTSTERPQSTTSSNDLLSTLPWLKSILNQNGILSLPSGNYKLGLNETVTDNVTCSNTPLNTTGHCSLLHSCPQVHSLLTSSDVFVRHFCVLKNEYAGVCCPNTP